MNQVGWPSSLGTVVKELITFQLGMLLIYLGNLPYRLLFHTQILRLYTMGESFCSDELLFIFSLLEI